MLDTNTITAVFQYLDRTSEHESNAFNRSGVHRNKAYQETDAAPFLNYLLEPYEHGYWSLTGRWKYGAPLAQYLAHELSTFEELDKQPDEKRSWPALTLARSLSEEKRAQAVRISARVCAIMRLFSAALDDEKGTPPRFFAQDDWIGGVDLKKLRVSFKDAYEIFKTEIHLEASFTGDAGPDLVALPGGLVVLTEPPWANGGRLAIASATRAPAELLCRFFNALDLLEKPQVRRVFAPDKLLFKPYFAYVSAFFSYVVKDEQTSGLFTQALDYYRAQDYKHCVSALGLIAEDYFTRIYNSLLRQQCSNRLSLGQIFDALHQSVVELLQQKQPGLKQIDTLYEQTSNLKNPAELKIVLRELMDVIKQDRSHFTQRIEEAFKPATHISPFPARMRENATEILRMRDAASHNTRIAFGRYEADRTLYCLVSLIAWWQTQLDELDWGKTKIEILEELVAVAN